MKKLPRDPFLADAWQQLLTAGLCLPHVGRIVLVIGAPLVGLMVVAWGVR